MNEVARDNQASNARRLEMAVITSLTVDRVPTENEIFELATALRSISIYSVSDSEFDQVIKRLHEALTLDMGIGNCIVDKHDPWLLAKKATIEPYYWDRYKTNLIKEGWGPKVVGSLDKVTDEILDLLGDPSGSDGWPRRGLVMGDVQSGKTSNYTGLICKAADAGYKLVILLTGTLESLRKQTQERLDAGFVGLDSSGVVSSRNRQRREIGVGLISGARSAGVFTSTVGDFKADVVNQLGFKLKDYREPVLLVVKKNRRIIDNLTEWLINFNASVSGKINLPLLLIDDEADNASINTNKTKITAINGGIRTLLNVFPRSSYVGFTATPFANVFIDPETTTEMEGDDLFPRDFIYTLDAPNNYVGATSIFGEDSKFQCLESIEDAEPYFPRGQKSDSVVDDIPPSLIYAIQCYLVVNAIMDVRQGTPKHRSMLVNVSHFTLIQDQVKDIIYFLLSNYQQDIRNYSGLSPKEALKNTTLAALHNIFTKHYSGVGVGWGEVQAALAAATLPIEVRSVNQKSGPGSLNYALYKENGLRVIAVGGNSLARGLTLEGLCVSYFYRTTQMYDALLQMGRWFGYRTGYEDLFKIWTTDETANWYSLIASATDELRSEIRKMQQLRLKPIDFGLRVRSHPDSLLITARNKMRHSEEIQHTLSVSQESLEAARLLNDGRMIAANFTVASNLVSKICSAGFERSREYKYPVWHDVDKALIVEFLKNFASHPLNLKLQSKDLAAFIHQAQDLKMDFWDVSIPSGSGGEFEILPGLRVDRRKRKILVEVDKKSILVNEKKMRVGSAADEKVGLTKEMVSLSEQRFFEDPRNAEKKNVPGKAYNEFRERPLLLLHFLLPEVKSEQAFAMPRGTDALVAIGLSFPKLSNTSMRMTYRINLVELRNMLADDADSFEDDGDEQEDE
jgi:hypothetical protein